MRLAHSVCTKVTYCYNNLFTFPITLEIDVECNSWQCLLGGRMFSGSGIGPLSALTEILEAIRTEATEALQAIDNFRKEANSP